MKRLLALIQVLIISIKVNAFVPPLEREINVTFSNEPVKSALAKIQEQTNLIFSYRHDIIDKLEPITVQLKQKTVREALALILPKTIFFKQKSNYIILKEKPLEKNPKKVEMSGYVIDKSTEKKLPNVTVYDKTTLKSVTTDEYGYYSITVPNENQCLQVNKENYQDTCVSPNQQNAITNIPINPLSDVVILKDSISLRSKLKSFSNKTNELFRQFEGYINTRNVTDSITRKTQISLLPFVGSNGLLSGNVYNKYSFNVFGGYSRGTKWLELGGFFNVDKEKTNGLQAAGFFNIVGDSASGGQLAGFLNITGRNMYGLQNAGFVNLNVGSMNGVQNAGFVNFNGNKLKGVQLSGMANINMSSVKGLSAAGFLNFTRYTFEGVQLSGFLNVTGDTLRGCAITGFVNSTWCSKSSLEVSGFLNTTQYGFSNTQISGFANATSKGDSKAQIAVLNVANKLTGVQLGLVNYADSASGIPIGFLSVVRHGMHQLELATDELHRLNIGFRTGVKSFYNVFNFGISDFSKSPLWSMGYGVGSSFKIKTKWRGDFNLSANHISSGSLYFATSELYRLYIGAEYKVQDKFWVAIGPTFNLYWTDKLTPDYDKKYNYISPYNSYEKQLPNHFNLKGWLGLKAALRFL